MRVSGRLPHVLAATAVTGDTLLVALAVSVPFTLINGSGNSCGLGLDRSLGLDLRGLEVREEGAHGCCCWGGLSRIASLSCSVESLLE